VEKELRRTVAEQGEEIESLNEELDNLRHPAAEEGPNYQILYVKANNSAKLWKENAEANTTAKAKADELTGELATARQRVESLGVDIEKLKFELWYWKKKAGVPEPAPRVVVGAPPK
jgi:predicted RNase H-like nuclease (RuvC/YqgF family)